MPLDSFDEQAQKAFPAPIILISGDNSGEDHVTIDKLPQSERKGNLTGTLLDVLKKDPSLSWRKCMDQCKAENPKIASTRPFKMSQKFRLSNEGGGTKRALLIGIAYKKSNSNAHKNVYAMKEYLLTQGFEESNIQILMDNNKELNPSKVGILRQFSRLVKKCEPVIEDKGRISDSAFLYFCGHGGELDNEKYILYPNDYTEAKVIQEEDILNKLLFIMPCPLYMVIDLVTSGPGIELPYSYSPRLSKADNNDGKNSEEISQTVQYAIGNTVALAAGVALAGGAVAASQTECCEAFCTGGDCDCGLCDAVFDCGCVVL